MNQYLVTTKDNQIVLSQPALPITPEDLTWVNTQASTSILYEALKTKVPNLIHCEIMQIDWDNDVVQHLIVQG